MPSIGPNKPYICRLLLNNNLYEAVPSLSSDKKNERMNEMKIYHLYTFIYIFDIECIQIRLLFWGKKGHTRTHMFAPAAKKRPKWKIERKKE